LLVLYQFAPNFRVLGALQDTQHKKEKLVQDVALKANISYGEALPFLDKHMESSKAEYAPFIIDIQSIQIP